MAHNNVYTVGYLLYGYYSQTQFVSVLAKNKEEAYEKATYEVIPQKEDKIPFAAWVFSVTYNNGNYRKFNTFAGKPY